MKNPAPKTQLRAIQCAALLAVCGMLTRSTPIRPASFGQLTTAPNGTYEVQGRVIDRDPNEGYVMIGQDETAVKAYTYHQDIQLGNGSGQLVKSGGQYSVINWQPRYEAQELASHEARGFRNLGGKRQLRTPGGWITIRPDGSISN